MRLNRDEAVRINNDTKATDELLLYNPGPIPLSFMGLARCRFCMSLLYHRHTAHSDNPRWGGQCSPLREFRCTQSLKLFMVNCHHPGAENW